MSPVPPSEAIPLRGLRLGVATSATQIEGDCTATNWHDWYEAGRVADNTSPDVAARHWRNIESDTALLGALGVKDYRMGLEWGRLETAPGVFDEAAMEVYRGEIQGLLAAGIHPLVTLHHFSNPAWFERAGGWLRRDAVDIFVRFATWVVERLADLITDFITINEPNVVASNGYVFAAFPPGRRNFGEAMRATRAMGEAHVLTYRVIHERIPGAKVGVANHLRVFAPTNAHSPLDRLATRAIRYAFNEIVTEAMCRGRFLPPMRPSLRVRPGRYYDFLGLNYYTRSFVSPRHPDHVPAGPPVQDLGWEIHPEGIAELARWLHHRYNAPVWVTENGTCDADDSFRARYLWEHLACLLDAGVPVERYYHWTFYDNWEWSEGNLARFGLVANDVDTQTRSLKDSGRFYAHLVSAGALTPEAHARHVAHQEYRRK